MLQRLFGSLNFGWGVRVSGLVSGVCCAAATLIVTSLPSPKTADTCTLNIKTFADSRYVLLAIGSSFVSLGAFFISPQYTCLTGMPRSVYPVFLHRGICTPAVNRPPDVILRSSRNERRRVLWARFPRVPLRLRGAL